MEIDPSESKFNIEIYWIRGYFHSIYREKITNFSGVYIANPNRS